MAWCPFAAHRPLPETHGQGRITPRAVILHTAAGASESLYDFFRNSSNLESHFMVGESGHIEQYIDTTVRADANYNANDFAVSIETGDGGVIKPWNSAQVASLVRLVGWICDTHGIPKRQIPSAYSSGIGWHVQFGAPGAWTPSVKSCPGGPRIHQTKTVIIPRVAQGGGGGAAPAAPESPSLLLLEDNMAEFSPSGERSTVSLTVPLKGAGQVQPVIQWFNAGAIQPRPKLRIWWIKFVDGDGEERALNCQGAEVQPGNPWWGGHNDWALPRSGDVSMGIEYSYECPVDEYGHARAKASVGWREN